MISAGNDIVALKTIDKQRTNLPAFYSKFITPAELALHKPAGLSFETFVWLLWSVKESAYKYLKRRDADLVFSPSKFIVQRIETSIGLKVGQLQSDQEIEVLYEGAVFYNTYELCFKSLQNNEFVASIIDAGSVYWGVKTIDKTDYESQSKSVRLFVLERLNSLFASDDLWIKKHPVGYPVLFNNQQQMDIPISFAHHDRYVSYSFQIPK